MKVCLERAACARLYWNRCTHTCLIMPDIWGADVWGLKMLNQLWEPVQPPPSGISQVVLSLLPQGHSCFKARAASNHRPI